GPEPDRRPVSTFRFSDSATGRKEEAAVVVRLGKFGQHVLRAEPFSEAILNTVAILGREALNIDRSEAKRRLDAYQANRVTRRPQQRLHCELVPRCPVAETLHRARAHLGIRIFG